MLFSAQFPESSVQLLDLGNAVGIQDVNDTKVADTRLRFRCMGCGCNYFRGPKGWGLLEYREDNSATRGRRTDKNAGQQGYGRRILDKLE
jgi:hypothetical protein